MSTSARDRDSIIYEELFRTHFSSLCYFARKYVADFDTSKEIVHKVFVSIWENRADFDFDKPAKSYLFTSVHNRCMNYLRDQKKFASSENIDDPEKYTHHAVDADQMESAELEARIWKAIDTLPDRCKEIFVLSRFEEKKYGEIATHLGISVKTVETQMSKALSLLREHLKDYIYVLLLFIVKRLW